MNSRSLPQNKAPLSSEQLVKFIIFIQKNVLTIRALSLQTEGTIMIGGCGDHDGINDRLRNSRRNPFHCREEMTISFSSSASVHRRTSTVVELGPTMSTPSDASRLVRVQR